MLYLIESIFGLIFFFQPPILFYLNHKLKWRLRILPLAFLSFILGWALCFPSGLLHSATSLEGNSYPFVFLLFGGLIFGWIISGGLVLLWSPVITFFVVRNKKIKCLMALVAGMLILSIAFLHYSGRYDWGVPGNRLLHNASIPAGFFDCSFVSVFEAENDLLKKKLVDKWQLQEQSCPTSFAAISDRRPDWWPTKDVLENLEGYAQICDSRERYRSMWYDPNSKRLYLEYGHW